MVRFSFARDCGSIPQLVNGRGLFVEQNRDLTFDFVLKLKLELKLKLNQKNYITKNFNLLKLETASARVNLHGLMVRFSFARDCGSIPHEDSTGSMFFSIISCECW